MKVVAIVQARLGSTRLPGKVLLELAGEPVLARVINRLGRARRLDEVVVATTTEPADDPIARLCERRNWPCGRGSELDVLDRYYHVAKVHNADAVVRVTSDCPLIEPTIVDRAVEMFLAGQPELDYAANTLPPRTFPRGLDTEVVKMDALERAWAESADKPSREHVTYYLYSKPGRFRLRGMTNDHNLSHMRWTLDTPEDLDLLRRIYDHFGDDRFAWTDVLKLLEARPEWLEINRRVVQKKPEDTQK